MLEVRSSKEPRELSIDTLLEQILAYRTLLVLYYLLLEGILKRYWLLCRTNIRLNMLEVDMFSLMCLVGYQSNENEEATGLINKTQTPHQSSSIS